MLRMLSVHAMVIVIALVHTTAHGADGSSAADFDPAYDVASTSPSEVRVVQGLNSRSVGLDTEALKLGMAHELALYEKKLAFMDEHMDHRNTLRLVGVLMAVLLGFSGVGLIVAGWRFAPDEKIDAEIRLKWIGIIKVSGASSGIVALAMSVFLIQQLINDSLTFQ